jgi:hypothetical protein
MKQLAQVQMRLGSFSTFVVCIKDILIRVTKRELISNWWFARLPVSSAARRLRRDRFEEFSLRLRCAAWHVSRRSKIEL